MYKFKAFFNKQKFSFFNKNILIVHSENTILSSLVHLLQESVSQNGQNSSATKINYLCIYENINNRQTLQDLKKIVIEIGNKTQNFNFEIYLALLSEFCFNREYIQLINSFKLQEDLENIKALNVCFGKLWDDTARQDLLCKLRHKLIIAVAKKLNCTLVLFNDFSIDLATEIVSNIVLGKGGNIFYENYFKNKKYSKIKFLYPMQKFIQREASTYIKFFNFANTEFDNRVLHEYYELSIQNITKKFLLKLNDHINFDNSIIYNVSKKMDIYNSNILQFQSCILCHALVNTSINLNDISSQFAKNFSKFMSKYGKNCEISINLFNTKNVKQFTFHFNFNSYNTHMNNFFINNSCIYHAKELNSIVFVCYACAVLLHNYN